jgi:cell division protein ZapA
LSERDPARVSVKILDKEYFVGCPPDERNALLESAEYLNKQMRDIRDTGKVLGGERIAVMAALNIAHELLQQRTQGGASPELGARLKLLRERVESALERRQA